LNQTALIQAVLCTGLASCQILLADVMKRIFSIRPFPCVHKVVQAAPSAFELLEVLVVQDQMICSVSFLSSAQ